MKLTCINCPMGCSIEVVKNGEELKVTGNRCKRGEKYAKAEVTNPTRIVTSTVKLIGGTKPVVSVKTASEIPKSLMFKAMDEINSAKVHAPVKIGDIVVKNICASGVDVVATCNAEKCDK